MMPCESSFFSARVALAFVRCTLSNRLLLMTDFPNQMGKRSSRQPRCKAEGCRNYPGEDTSHPGVGYCRSHENAELREAWNVAFEVARELDISPWDALLLAVRRAAGRVTWVDEQLSQAVRANDGDSSAREVARWLGESRKERSLLARTAKAAIDAGVAERLVRQVELEGKVISEVIGRVLEQLDLAPDQRVQAFTIAQNELLVLDPSTLGE